jgi:hypothetical protein
MYNLIILELPINQVAQAEEPDTQSICSGHGDTASIINKPVAKLQIKLTQITADAGNASCYQENVQASAPV